MAVPPANPTAREHLRENLAPFNQIRNALYQLIRFMQDKKVSGPDDLHRMGRDIARTFSNYWLPPPGDPTQVLREVYLDVTGSKVKVDLTGKNVRVVDKKCRLCKVKYPDIDHAGCELIVAMIAEFFVQARAKDATSINLKLVGVEESRARGNERCVHLY